MKLFTASLGSLLVAGSVYGATTLSVAPGNWLGNWQATSTDNAYVRGDVTPISPKITGFVVDVPIKDNQKVAAGQILFRIEDNDYRARVEQAQAALAGKRAAIVNLESRLKLQEAAIEQAQAALDGAHADADRARKDFTRSVGLLKSGTATQANVDLTQSANLGAISRVSQAKANLVAAHVQTDVLESQRPQLLADIEGAAAALRLAEIDLESTTIRAPVDGHVGERQARVGQFVKPGAPLIAFVENTRWVIANFKETQLAGMQTGDPAMIEIDGVPDVTYKGHVESVSPASGAQFALLPPDNATGNFTRIVQRVPVRITLDENQAGLDRPLPGMSARVAIE
jgi:membrane fusion protein (multidrug efflux system)